LIFKIWAALRAGLVALGVGCTSRTVGAHI